MQEVSRFVMIGNDTYYSIFTQLLKVLKIFDWLVYIEKIFSITPTKIISGYGVCYQ